MAVCVAGHVRVLRVSGDVCLTLLLVERCSSCIHQSGMGTHRSPGTQGCTAALEQEEFPILELLKDTATYNVQVQNKSWLKTAAQLNVCHSQITGSSTGMKFYGYPPA